MYDHIENSKFFKSTFTITISDNSKLLLSGVNILIVIEKGQYFLCQCGNQCSAEAAILRHSL